jgi:N-acetyl-1-D-myo-inositol-2-amino-2-deoxy-alpha-D-glucopyranoside deacetylase
MIAPVGRSRTLMIVVAHPDDDAYALSGTVALHGDEPGFRYVLVHATDGASGDIADGFPATPETLGDIRRSECEAAWRAHGRVPDRHEWLGLDDGSVDQVPFDLLVDSIAAVMEQEQPDVVGTFGPDGVTGHPDHITVGAATDAAFGRFAGSGHPGFQRLVHGALPQSVFERWNARRLARGLEPFDPERIYHLRGVPDAEIGITVDCRSVAHRIVAGLMQHKSQLHVLHDDPTDVARWEHIVGSEHLVVAWPPWHTSSTRLTDVFEGLV